MGLDGELFKDIVLASKKSAWLTTYAAKIVEVDPVGMKLHFPVMPYVGHAVLLLSSHASITFSDSQTLAAGTYQTGVHHHTGSTF